MYHKHSVGSRLVAFLIDMLIIGTISTFLVSLGVGSEVEYLPGFTVKTLTYWQDMLLYVVYFVGFAIFNGGITIGKMVLKLKITSSGYEKLDQNKLIIREIIKCFLMPISLISFIIVILKSDRKSIHDMIMNTYVVKEVKEVSDPYNLQRNNFHKQQKDDVLRDDYYEGIDEESRKDDDYYN